MRRRLAFLCIVLLFLSTSAFAQNANDYINIFRGVVQGAMRQAAQLEWRKLPPNEIACLDQQSRNQGASIDDLINRGVMPSDPRLSQLRSNCRVQIGQQSAPPVGAQPSPYVVDGLALYGHVRPESQEYQQYHCSPSEKFPGFTWCHKEKTERTNRGEVISSNSILHNQNGEAVYVNRYIEPAFFGPNDVRAEIDRLSAKFGEPPREFRMPQRAGLPDAVIAVWGKIQLEALDASDVSIVASGGSRSGLLVSFLGDLQRSAKAGVPVYRLTGGAGFLWAATFRNDGRGVLRFLTIDASQITQPSQVAVNPGSQSPTVAPSPPPPQPSELAKIKTAAEKGDAEAQFRLGTIFAEGRDVTKDETQAANWYRKAADQGHAEARFRLGSMFAEGQGVEKNLVQATEWVRKAAEQGNTNAEYNSVSCWKPDKVLTSMDQMRLSGIKRQPPRETKTQNIA